MTDYAKRLDEIADDYNAPLGSADVEHFKELLCIARALLKERIATRRRMVNMVLAALDQTLTADQARYAFRKMDELTNAP